MALPCGCSDTCLCTVVEGPGIDVSGDGSAATPYTVSADLVTADTDCITLTGDGGATALQAALVIDPASPVLPVCGPAGLSIPSITTPFEISENGGIPVPAPGNVLDLLCGLVSTAPGKISIDPTSAAASVESSTSLAGPGAVGAGTFDVGPTPTLTITNTSDCETMQGVEVATFFFELVTTGAAIRSANPTVRRSVNGAAFTSPNIGDIGISGASQLTTRYWIPYADEFVLAPGAFRSTAFNARLVVVTGAYTWITANIYHWMLGVHT